MTRAAYLPLDPMYPAERVGAMMHDAGVSAVITSTADGLDARVADAARLAQAEADADADGDVPTGHFKKARLENLPMLLADGGAPQVTQAHPAPLPAGHPSDLAYVLFTSGSTGRPKGVQVTQRNLLNFLGSMAGGLLRTSTRPTMNQLTESVRQYDHSP